MGTRRILAGEDPDDPRAVLFGEQDAHVHAVQILSTAQATADRYVADAQAYSVEATLKPLLNMDTKALQVLASRSIDPRLMVAMAFQEIAANATKVGNLNISPELLDTLLTRDGKKN